MSIASSLQADTLRTTVSLLYQSIAASSVTQRLSVSLASHTLPWYDLLLMEAPVSQRPLSSCQCSTSKRDTSPYQLDHGYRSRLRQSRSNHRRCRGMGRRQYFRCNSLCFVWRVLALLCDALHPQFGVIGQSTILPGEQ